MLIFTRITHLVSGDYEQPFTDLLVAAPNRSQLTDEQLIALNHNCVMIETYSINDTPRRSGNGVLITNSGYILTTFWVIEGARTISVTLPGGEQADATVVGWDLVRGLAVLKLPAQPAGSQGLPIASGLPALDTRVMAIGNPSAEVNAVEGRVSTLPSDDEWRLQATFPLSPAQPGVPLLNEHGEIVGIILEVGEASDETDTVEPSFAASAVSIRVFLRNLYLNDDAFGSYALPHGTYTGELRNGVAHGYGTSVFDNGDYYFGYYHDGNRGPYGTYFWDDGEVYSGNWHPATGERSGQATLIFPDGEVYIGGVLNGFPRLQGVMLDDRFTMQSTWSSDANPDYYTIVTNLENGDVVIGLIEDGLWQGPAFTYHPDGSVTMVEMKDGDIAPGYSERRIK